VMKVVTGDLFQVVVLGQREWHGSVGRRGVSRSLRTTLFEVTYVSPSRLLIQVMSISSPVEVILIVVNEGILPGPHESLHRGLIPLW
jgi:hypothetical protein